MYGRFKTKMIDLKLYLTPSQLSKLMPTSRKTENFSFAPIQTVTIMVTRLRCITGQGEAKRASFHQVLVREEALKVLPSTQNKKLFNRHPPQTLLIPRRRTLPNHLPL